MIRGIHTSARPGGTVITPQMVTASPRNRPSMAGSSSCSTVAAMIPTTAAQTIERPRAALCRDR